MLSTRMATHQNVGHCHEVGVSLSSRVEAKPQALIPCKEAAHRTITEGGRPLQFIWAPSQERVLAGGSGAGAGVVLRQSLG